MSHLGAPPAGWYVDPSGRHRARYWDGSSWTAHVTDDVSGDDALRPPPGVVGEAATAPVPFRAAIAVDDPTVLEGGYVSAAAEATAGVAGAVAAIAAGERPGWIEVTEGQPEAGWYPDPTGRHEVRFWDGLQWTERVATQGLEVVEPVGGPMYGMGVDTSTAATSADSGLRTGRDAGTDVGDLPPLATLDEPDDEPHRPARRRRVRRTRAPGLASSGAEQGATRTRGRGVVAVSSRLSGLLVLVGAAVLFLGSTMSWIKVTGPRLAQESMVSGLDGDGRVTAGIAVVLALFGLGMVSGRFVKLGGVRIGSMGVLVAGAAALAICGLDMADVIDRAPRLGIEAGATADFGKGLWVSFAGVVTAVTGGLIGFTDRTQTD